MAIKRGSDALALNVPHSDLLVFGTGGEQFAIRREANGADIQVTFFVLNSVVLQFANFSAVAGIKDLGTSVAAGGHIFAVGREADTADDGFVDEVVEQSDIEHSRYVRVEYSMPIVSSALQ